MHIFRQYGGEARGYLTLLRDIKNSINLHTGLGKHKQRNQDFESGIILKKKKSHIGISISKRQEFKNTPCEKITQNQSKTNPNQNKYFK